MIPIYVLKNDYGNIPGRYVYLSHESAEEALKKSVGILRIDSCYLAYMNDKAYLIRLYSGHLPNGEDIHKKVFHDSEIYPTVELAKNDRFWVDALTLANEKPDEYHIFENYICSDKSGKPFWYGSISEGKFNVCLIELSVEK